MNCEKTEIKIRYCQQGVDIIVRQAIMGQVDR